MSEPYKNENTLRRLYIEEKQSIEEIGDRLGCSSRTVSRWMDKFGIQKRPRGSEPRGPYKDERKLLELYESREMTVGQIAEKFGVSNETIRYWMDKFGIDRRHIIVAEGNVEWSEARTRETLQQLYVDEGMSTTEIGDEFNVSSTTVATALEEFEIERRDRLKAAANATRVDYASLRTNVSGYEVWSVLDWDERRSYTVSVHRLLAVSEYGLDAVEGMHVHHKNHIPWHNTPGNITLMTPSEHSSYHQNVTSPPQPNVDQSVESGGSA